MVINTLQAGTYIPAPVSRAPSGHIPAVREPPVAQRAVRQVMREKPRRLWNKPRALILVEIRGQYTPVGIPPHGPIIASVACVLFPDVRHAPRPVVQRANCLKQSVIQRQIRVCVFIRQVVIVRKAYMVLRVTEPPTQIVRCVPIPLPPNVPYPVSHGRQPRTALLPHAHLDARWVVAEPIRHVPRPPTHLHSTAITALFIPPKPFPLRLPIIPLQMMFPQMGKEAAQRQVAALLSAGPLIQPARHTDHHRPRR